MQRTTPSIPLHSANPRITPRQILSSNKGLLFAGGPHTWPEPALLRNARNGTVCVSQRKLAAANYAPLTALGAATSNMKARNYIKLREKGRCRGGWRGKTRGRPTVRQREREREIRGEVQTYTAHANRAFSAEFWTARKRSAAPKVHRFLNTRY